MKTINTIFKQLCLSALFVASTLSISQANGCGLSSDGKDWSRYSCVPRPGKETTIVGVNISTGGFGCKYGSAESWSEALSHDSGCSAVYDRAIKNDSENSTISRIHPDVADDLAEKTEVIAELLKKKGIVYDEKAWEGVIDTDVLYTDLTTIYTNSRNRAKKSGKPNFDGNWNETFVSALAAREGKSAIDSHTDYKRTLAATITAAFTVDPDFFEEGYLNHLGELSLKIEGQTLDAKPPAEGAIAWIKSLFPGTAANVATYGLSNPLDFMDKQVLGYFVHVIELLREVYNEIVFMFFIIGGAYSFGYYSYKKGLEKYGKEPFNLNKMTFMSSTLTAFLFFSAPAINDKKLENVTELRGAERADVENWSSLGQETVRYVAQSSNYFANLSSDYVMQAYLSMVGKKSGFLDIGSEDISSMVIDIESVERSKRVLLAKMNFYTNICRPFFEKTGDDEFFDGTKEIQSAASLVVTAEQLAVLTNTKLGAQRIEYEMCSGIEAALISDVNRVAMEIVNLREQLNSYKDILNSGAESLKRLKGLVELMAWGQSNFGWVFSASIPLSYFFFDNAEIFLYDRMHSPGETPSIFMGKVSNKADQVKEKFDYSAWEELGNFAEDKTLAAATNGFFQASYFFILPLFPELFKGINGVLQSVAVGKAQATASGNVNAIAKADDQAKGFFSKMKSVAGLLSRDKSKTGEKAIDDMADSWGTKLFSAVMVLAAVWIASVLYVYLVSAITIITLSALLVLKITLYYIELMLFFLTVPAKGLYYVLMGSSSGKNYLAMYTTSLASLFMSPLLIVLVTAVLIPAGKFFQSFFQALMKMLGAVISNGADMVQGASRHAEVEGSVDSDLVDRIGVSVHKIMLVSGMEGLTMVFSHFAVLLLGIILIINFKTWFMKMVGMEGGVDSFKDTSGEIRQGAAGKALNPVG